jgi:O-antigen/teichoic acid export membrane protein
VAAAPALSVLAAALPFFFVNYALTHLVIAWDGQRAYLGVTAAALATNLIANTLLIPDGGMRGAAVATLLTEVVVSAGCVWALAGRSATTASDVPAVAMSDAAALSGDSL